MNSYHYRRGGSDVVYFDHAALFEEMGWDNTCFSMHHPDNLATSDSADFADLVDFEYPGVGPAKIRTAWRTIYNNQARKRLRALLDRTRIDIAHAHCIYHHLTPAVFSELSKRDIPVVLTAHDLKIACPAYKMMNRDGICEKCKGGSYVNVLSNRCIKNSVAASGIVALEAYLHRTLGSYEKHVSHIVAPSRFYRNKLIEWGIPGDKISHIPNFTRIVDRAFIGDYSGPVLYFGRLSEEKGLFTLIEAAKAAQVPVDIVGVGPLADILKAQADRIGAPVNFPGRLEGDNLWRVVGMARAVVLPSQWYENAPMSVLEAFQLERPVIGSEIGGIPELVESTCGKAGWLFPMGSTNDLAHCLQTVSDASRAELSARGKTGNRLAMSDFSRENYYNAMTSLYTKLQS